MTTDEKRDIGAEIESLAAEMGITMECDFIPFSKSRNKAEKLPSLNWIVTISKGGKAIISTDYMQGSGHCPAYKADVKQLGGQDTERRNIAIRNECETGLVWLPAFRAIRKPIASPRIADVLSSLCLDSSAIDSTFENWASDFGYDTDSRKAEAIYRQCLDIAIKLRSGLGDANLSKLRELASEH